MSNYLDHIHADEHAGVNLPDFVQLGLFVLLRVRSQVVLHGASQLWVQLHRLDLGPRFLPSQSLRARNVVLVELGAVQLLIVGLHSFVWPHLDLEMRTRTAEVLDQLSYRLPIRSSGP